MGGVGGKREGPGNNVNSIFKRNFRNNKKIKRQYLVVSLSLSAFYSSSFQRWCAFNVRNLGSEL